MRVLLAEDAADLVEILAEGLRAQCMAVDVAEDGARALELLAVHGYDVLVLDRDLPEVHGDDVCRTVTGGHGPRPRVLMLTAAGTVDDRVAGLNLGADDYLAKPFDFAELAARILTLGRRARPEPRPVLVLGDLTVDTASRTAVRRGRELPLTGKEFGVLEALLAVRGAVLGGDELLRRVWDAHADPHTNTVRVTVSRLRRKLGEPELIETVPGAGYRVG